MASSRISGLFVAEPTLPEGVTAATVAQPGFLVAQNDGFELVDRRVMTGLPVLLGLMGGAVGLCLPTLLAFGLSWVAFDIFTIRRGTTLVAVLTLLVGGAGFWWMLSAGERLFARDTRRAVAREDISRSDGDTHVTLIWDEGGTRVGAVLYVPQPQRPQVAAVLG